MSISIFANASNGLVVSNNVKSIQLHIPDSGIEFYKVFACEFNGKISNFVELTCSTVTVDIPGGGWASCTRCMNSPLGASLAAGSCAQALADMLEDGNL